MAQRCEDLDGHDEATPPFLKRYFQRLHEELPEYEFTEDFVPFHSSYDNWHFLGKRRRKLASTASTSSGSRPQSTRSQSDYSESKVGDLFVIARVSAHNLRLEREFQICQHASTNSDPEGKHFVRPVTFARLPARQPGEERLSVSLVEAPGRNYLRNMTSFGPNFYNGAPIAYSPSAPLEKVSLPCFLSFAIGAAECLELLHHSENLVHGELRGDAFHYNRETGAVRLVNFGSGAKAFADGLTSAGWAGLVKQRGIEHKLQFIAPEQTGRLGAAEPDSRTDVYSLGILFYSMLVGKAVFEGKTPLDIMQAVLSRRGPSVTTIRPDVPDALAAVISKMTAKQMDERYKSITGAKMDLLAINKALEDGDHDTLAKFKVGANDISCFFTLPTHLVGREAQRSTIIDVIQRASLRSSRAAPIQRKGLYSLSSSSFSMMSGERADISTLDEMMSDSTSSGGADRDRDSRLNSTLEIEPREHQKSGSLDTIGSAGSSGRGTHNDMRPYDNASSHGSRESNHDGHDMSTTQHPQLSETSSVLRTAQKLKNRGRIEIIAVGGVAGLGKSSLVHSIAPVARKTGYYASAKFDQVRVSPFDGLIRVMSSLFKQIFSEPNVGTQFHENIRSFVKPFWGILHQSLELPPWLLSPGTTGRESVLQANQQSTTPGHDKERKACNNSQSAQDWLRSGGSSKTSRFMHVYLDVLRLLAFQKVLTLTLDDLQFADVESQDLLIMIVAARIPVILILTHRGEESLPQSMRKLLERATKVELGPFTDDDTGRFVAETIGRGEEYCLPLTAVIFEKTRGNPFFVRECLNLAYQKGAIYYSWESARFEFSMDKLFSDFSSPDPGAYSSKDFIVRKIKALPMDAQTLLAWASIIGNTFNFKLVQQVMSCECSRMSPPELKPPNSGDVVAGLQACVNAFMLSATEDDERFKFSHDRYVTAADSLCEPFDRQEMHYIIASSMMKHAPFDTVLHPNKYLYEQARHICEALNVIKKRASAKAPYRQLLYQAAECARDDGARGSSLNYFRCCLDLLPEKPWIESSDDGTYVETLTVMTKAAEAAWVVGDYKEAGVLLSEIHRHGRNATDRAPATILQSRILAQQGKGRDAFLLLREALAEMGGHLPTTSYEECDEEFQRLLPLVQERRADIAAAHSPNASNDTQTLGALLTELLSVSYWSDALLFYQTTLVFMAIFAERGFFAQAPLGLIHFSSIAMDRFHLILSAVDLGNRALEALQGYDYDYYTAGRGLTMHTLFLGHLSTNWRESFSALNQGSEAASAAGDKGLHLLNIGITAAYQVWSSFDLVEVEAFVGSVDDVYEDWAESTRGGVFLVAVRQFSRAMQGKTYARTSTDVLGDENHSSEQYEKFLLENSSEPNRPMTFYNSYKLNALYRFGHYAEAVALGEKMMQYMGDTGCVPYVYQNYCYVALALLALVREKPFDWPAREKMLQRVAEYRSRIELVASFDSVNYLTMLKILEAEIADVRGEYGDVLHSYEAAINNASLHECLMEYSLATELYADFLERRGASRPSRGVVLDAVSAYRRIGAFGKADALAQRYEFILLGTRSLSACDAGTQTNEDTGATTYQIDKIEVEESSADRTQEWLHPALPATTPSGGSSRDPQIALSGGLSAGGLDMIDLASILESSQLLSSELNVEKLLKRLTEIVVDSTGADRCGLIVEQDGGGWCVAAVGVPDGTEPPPSGMLLDEIDDPVAKQITLYVLRFKEAVFVKNVLEDERFANVPPAWLASNPEGASLIALPILHGNDTLLGSLFVEGGPNTFSERTVTLLKLLVNQLTISIANALLFKQVERVSARNASMLEVQKQALTQAREAEKKAKDAEAKATENAKAKSMFLANVSHELRTPLNGVIGMSEMLKATPLSKDQEECADSIRVCADTLLSVINDILDFSKLEAGKLALFPVPLSLTQTIGEVVRALSYTNVERSLKTVEHLELDPKLVVMGDPVRLHQVLMNLMSNAYKFTAHGSVLVRAKVESETADEIRIQISVTDTGIGISEEAQMKLFQPFSQADSSTARSYGGTGLGLSIVKAIVEKVMKGRVWMESKVGVGTTVAFSLPFPKVKPSANGQIPSTGHEREADPMSDSSTLVDGDNQNERPVSSLAGVARDQIKVAVAEDNPINQKIAINFVSRLGFRVVAFDDGQQAVDGLARASAEGSPFHLVLMDVQMPVLDGYNATRAIRRHEDPVVRDVLVIAMTASAIQGDREKCLEAGMQAHLTKPVKIGTLKQMLERYLDQPPVPIPNLQQEVKTLVSAVVSQVEQKDDARVENENPHLPERPKSTRKETTSIHLRPEEMYPKTQSSPATKKRPPFGKKGSA